MRFSAALLLVAAAIVSAASTTTTSAAASSTGTCDAQSVFDLCIESTTAILNNCTPSDYICMCQKQTDVLTCYNTCPNDPLHSSAKGTNASYCQAAAQQSSASIAASGTPTVVSSSVKATTSASSTSGTATSASKTSASAQASTQASAQASSTGAATNVYAPVGGLAAVAIGIVGLL
ncbi:hypothetical protein E2P81_ATG01561 [Venturia nashicola]|uniref:GPI anchored serine-threonine rich protein n=1 Tax=Venturia nashicola TaxID=86259 RepID=A0A4Z1NIC7_9PEZI|nr:hypothetical protein E6O75_ATG01600 [Venturia nashicola]TLD18833.1 hypothetical protein E2P81_ATG01561 [Venturia nashicola]